MKKTQENLEVAKEDASAGHTSPLDLIRLMGGRAHRVGGGRERSPDSMLAVYKNRLTYTFILDDEVASIHYDHQKGEIFFRGHNIKHLELNGEQKRALFSLQEILGADSEGKEFLSDYLATLERSLADK